VSCSPYRVPIARLAAAQAALATLDQKKETKPKKSARPSVKAKAGSHRSNSVPKRSRNKSRPRLATSRR